MDKADDTFDEGNRYAKRLLDRSHYSDCHPQSYRRRLSVMEALSKSSINPSSDRRYDGNPFEKEFSGANSQSMATGDQLEMTYVSTWPEDNVATAASDLSSWTYDAEPRDSLFCVKSPSAKAAAAATNRPATEYRRGSKQFRRDIVDSDADSIADALANPGRPLRHDPTLSIGERFGPLTSNELTMQSTLNLQFEREFEQCNAQMQLQGPDEFFGARVIEICEPTIIKFHRKSCDSEAIATQTLESDTYVKEDMTTSWIETDLDAPTSPASIETHLNAPTSTAWVKTDLDAPTSSDRIETDLDAPSSPQQKAIQAHTTTDLTFVKEDKRKSWKRESSNAEYVSALSLSSEDMRDLDREIDKLKLDDNDDFSERVTTPVRKISSTFEIVSEKSPSYAVNGKDNFRESNFVVSTGLPANKSSMENFDNYIKPASPKSTMHVLEDNNRQRREPNLSKTASFLKRHTSFLFKNLRTPKLVRRKSSVESTTKKTPEKTGSPWSQTNASALTRSNTIDSSDNEKPISRFQKQIRQMQADLPPDNDDTMTSEMESFLKVALRSGQYNSTMAHANTDTRDQTYSVSGIDVTDSKSRNERSMRKQKSTGTLNRTMSMYKSFRQKLRDKFRVYDPNNANLDAVANLDQQNVILEDLEPETREIVKQLQDKINIQNTLIHQTSKALQLCDSMPEFIASPERVEYERLLLLAILTKNVILREIDRLIDHTSRKKKKEAYKYEERGEVTLENIRLQLREDVLRRERQSGDIVEWFVVVVIQGVTVWASHAIACPIASPQICFPGANVISGLTPDFRLSIKVYSLKLQQLRLFNHDDKYHITRSYTYGSGNKIKTPKMLRRRKSVSPKQHKVKYTGAKETSFKYCGGVDLMLYDLKLPSPWPLHSLTPNSVLHGTVDLNFSCKLELSMFHSGFLTHCEETGDLAWNRRWCLLEGHKLLFWNYPREQEYKQPLYVVDLVNCVSKEIEEVDRRLCPRSKTLLLETKNPALENECIIIENRIRSVTRHLLSFDKNDELADWRSKLNRVVSALSDWNIINTS